MLVGAAGFGLVAATLVDEGLICPGFGDLVVQVDRVVEIGEGVVVVVLREIGDAAAIVGLGRVRRQRDRLGEVVDRLVLLIALLIDHAAAVDRRGHPSFRG